MSDFEDIRPYRDDEVRPVVDRLSKDETMCRALGKFTHPLLYKFFPGKVTAKVQSTLADEVAHVQTIHDVQLVIEKYLDRLIESTTTSLTNTGLDTLDISEPLPVYQQSPGYYLGPGALQLHDLPSWA